MPIDACYELAGRMRMHWRGFDGGTEARQSIAEFLDGVRARARPLGQERLTWPSWSSTASGREPDRYAVGPVDDPEAADQPRRPASGSTRSRCAARSGSSRPGAATPPAEAERLNDLFGDTSRWADTLKPLQFTTVSAMVPGFTGSTEVDLPVPFTYDLEIGSTRYFAGLDDGEIPLLLLFSGTVFSRRDGRLRCSRCRGARRRRTGCRSAVWREAIDVHFPDSAWIRMSTQTLDELQRVQEPRGAADLGRHAARAARARRADRAERAGHEP